MLSLFNRFISRMRSTHPVLGNRNLLIFIMEYLDGEDLFQVYQVCFSFRTTIQSMPCFEITMLRFTMKESNKCIEKLKAANSPPQPIYRLPVKTFNTTFPLMFMKRKAEIKPKQKIQQETSISEAEKEKWIKFVDYFHMYARDKGFKIQKREDFSNEDDWKRYKLDFTGFYHSYVDHIKTARSKERVSQFNLKNHLFNQYEKLVNNMNFRFCFNKKPVPEIKNEGKKVFIRKRDELFRDYL
ncbi:hypothetical protein SteCoe_15377 [Stentor coeruleus]|uniref:F-box domain-containing protein n=1 Tax=Stentor coeruleus TaxID=5963 RepID=A0A1R2C3U6_9CILI|nr:hypothetical protein SteCoe_15377 [Stentor coeruleus]